MDIIGRAVSNARGAFKRGANEWGDWSIPPNSLAIAAAGSAHGTEDGVLGISTVLQCIRVLHDDVKILPFAAYTGSKHGVKESLDDQPKIVTEPFGPNIPAAVGFGQIVVSRTLRGRAYAFITQRDKLGYPTQLQILHPDRVAHMLDRNGVEVVRINGTFYSMDEIIHIPGLMVPGALTGLDPISYMRAGFGLANDVAQFGLNFFRNGGNPSGVISVPGPGDRKQAREVKEVWEAGHSGVINAHRPAVMFGGATWTPMSVSPDQAQFLQTRQFSREEICGWFGVPLQRIMAITGNASQGGGKGLDTIDQGYATHTLLPITSAIEQAWDKMIPGGDRTFTRFDFSGLLRASALERAQIAQIYRLIGVLNRNEIRGDEGWKPIDGPDGEDYNVPFNTNSAVPPLTVEPGTEGLPVPGAPGGAM